MFQGYTYSESALSSMDGDDYEEIMEEGEVIEETNWGSKESFLFAQFPDFQQQSNTRKTHYKNFKKYLLTRIIKNDRINHTYKLALWESLNLQFFIVDS